MRPEARRQPAATTPDNWSDSTGHKCALGLVRSTEFPFAIRQLWVDGCATGTWLPGYSLFSQVRGLQRRRETAGGHRLTSGPLSARRANPVHWKQFHRDSAEDFAKIHWARPRGSQPCALFPLDPQTVSARTMHPFARHWIYTFVSVALVAGLALAGRLALVFSPQYLSRLIPLLVSLAAGALFGTAFGHLLPKSVGNGPEFSALLVGGILTFFVLGKALCVAARVPTIITATSIWVQSRSPPNTPCRLETGRW